MEGGAIVAVSGNCEGERGGTGTKKDDSKKCGPLPLYFLYDSDLTRERRAEATVSDLNLAG
jgi:hypothetical protein